MSDSAVAGEHWGEVWRRCGVAWWCMEKQLLPLLPLANGHCSQHTSRFMQDTVYGRSGLAENVPQDEETSPRYWLEYRKSGEFWEAWHSLSKLTSLLALWSEVVLQRDRQSVFRIQSQTARQTCKFYLLGIIRHVSDWDYVRRAITIRCPKRISVCGKSKQRNTPGVEQEVHGSW